jgi:thiol-disulfide isomerase/thioredoxin
MVEEKKMEEPVWVDPQSVTQTFVGDLIGTPFIQKKGMTDREKEESTSHEEATLGAVTESKYLGLFFSAGWCPPCKLMMKPLKDFYTDINMEKKQFEVLYVPVDKKEETWRQHYNQMPWLSLPFNDKRCQSLMDKYQI